MITLLLFINAVFSQCENPPLASQKCGPNNGNAGCDFNAGISCMANEMCGLVAAGGICRAALTGPVSTNGKCGNLFGNQKCPDGKCCSAGGLCGTSGSYCNAASQGIDICSEPINLDRRCGPKFGNAACRVGYCNFDGYCRIGATNIPSQVSPRVPDDALCTTTKSRTMNWCGPRTFNSITFDNTNFEPGIIEALLDDLNTLGWKGTFMMNVQSVKATPDPNPQRKCPTIQRIIDEGHELQLHGYHDYDNHYSNPLYSDRQFLNEIVGELEWLRIECPTLSPMPNPYIYKPNQNNIERHFTLLSYQNEFVLVSTGCSARDTSGANTAQKAFDNIKDCFEDDFDVGDGIVLTFHDRAYTGALVGYLALLDAYFPGYTWGTLSECHDLCSSDGPQGCIKEDFFNLLDYKPITL